MQLYMSYLHSVFSVQSFYIISKQSLLFSSIMSLNEEKLIIYRTHEICGRWTHAWSWKLFQTLPGNKKLCFLIGWEILC